MFINISHKPVIYCIFFSVYCYETVMVFRVYFGVRTFFRVYFSRFKGVSTT